MECFLWVVMTNLNMNLWSGFLQSYSMLNQGGKKHHLNKRLLLTSICCKGQIHIKKRTPAFSLGPEVHLFTLQHSFRAILWWLTSNIQTDDWRQQEAQLFNASSALTPAAAAGGQKSVMMWVRCLKCGIRCRYLHTAGAGRVIVKLTAHRSMLPPCGQMEALQRHCRSALSSLGFHPVNVLASIWGGGKTVKTETSGSLLECFIKRFLWLKHSHGRGTISGISK